METPLCDEANALVTVRGGRGFVVRSGRDLFVITAAHCLPRRLPPACSASDERELSYPNLVGPVGGKPSIRAACAFVDSVADIAVLRSLDGIATCEAGTLGDMGAPLWIEDAAEPIMGGMSDSPILTEGAAIGIVAVSNGFVTDDGKELGRAREGGPNPRLADHLPRWFSICA